MRRLLLCASLLFLLGATAACGEDWDAAPVAKGDDTGTPSEPSVTPAVLEGDFTSTEVTGHDLVEGSEIGLSFSPDDLAYRAGCNQMGGKYLIVGTELRLDGPGRSTMMGCDDDLQAQDQWLTELLTEGVEFELSGAELTLVSGDVTIVLAQD